jgi:hypothetical protein
MKLRKTIACVGILFLAFASYAYDPGCQSQGEPPNPLPADCYVYLDEHVGYGCIDVAEPNPWGLNDKCSWLAYNYKIHVYKDYMCCYWPNGTLKSAEYYSCTYNNQAPGDCCRDLQDPCGVCYAAQPACPPTSGGTD